MFANLIKFFGFEYKDFLNLKYKKHSKIYIFAGYLN